MPVFSERGRDMFPKYFNALILLSYLSIHAPQEGKRIKMFGSVRWAGICLKCLWIKIMYTVIGFPRKQHTVFF